MDFSKLTGAVPTDGKTVFFHPIGKFICEDKEKPAAEILEQISIPVLPEEAENIFASELGELFTISAVASRGKTALMLQYILNHPEKKIYFFSHEPAVITAERLALMMFDTLSNDKYNEIRPYAEYIISSLPIYVNDPALPKHSDRIIEDMERVKDGCIFIDGFDYFLAYLKNGGNPYVSGKTASEAAGELKRIADSVPVTISYLDMNKGSSRAALTEFSDKYAAFSIRNNIDSMFTDKESSYAVAEFKVIKQPHPDEKEEFTLRKKIYKSEAWFGEQNTSGEGSVPKEGLFWLFEDELLAFPFDKLIYREAVAKSGRTYNHKKLWQLGKPKGCNKPFNYYPRGRVAISNKGETIIYMNPNIDEKHIPAIKTAFNMSEDPIIRYDYSEHYKCYLDE